MREVWEYTCECVCMSVCVRDRKSEREREVAEFSVRKKHVLEKGKERKTVNKITQHKAIDL